MKPQIEIYDIQPVKGGYVAEYSTGEADVTLTISTETLLQYIVDGQRNILEVLNGNEYDQNVLDPETMLESDYFSVVSDYLGDL